MPHIATHIYESPCGPLLLASFDRQLVLCDWPKSGHRRATDRRLQRHFKADYQPEMSPVIAEAVTQLNQYFEHKRTSFDLPISLVGTPFQLRVWHALQEVPYGTTTSYADIARRIGQPTAVRAVASAIGANPVSILIPCHRVVGYNGALTGYAGGLNAKRFLLDLEGESGLFSTRVN